MSITKRTSVIPILVCIALLAAATVGAATINGTAGNDTLRGGAKADKLTGKGGNDKLYGRGGSDVLAGGPGNDLLVGGPGADKLSCGAGQDTARGDAQDKIGSDCEVVKGVPAPAPEPTPAPQPPPAPTPPAVSPVTAGQYQGQTQNGNFVFLTVLGDRTVTGFRVNDLPEDCNGGLRLRGGSNYGRSVFRIQDDGTFAAEGRWDGSDPSGDAEWTHWDVKLSGKFDTATTVSGTIIENQELNYQGTHYACSSGEIRWTATLQA